jgi:hypothetical protein
MAIITKPGSIQRNVAALFELNKVDLAAIASVVADTYFSNTTNWRRVKLSYESSTSNQIEIVVFDATQATPQSNFLVSDKSVGNFLIKKITIEDFDGGYHLIQRAELSNPTADFDVIF